MKGSESQPAPAKPTRPACRVIPADRNSGCFWRGWPIWPKPTVEPTSLRFLVVGDADLHVLGWLSPAAAALEPGRTSQTRNSARVSDHSRSRTAAGGNAETDDVPISLRLRSDAAAAIDVMFRVRNDANYYRLSLDGSAGRRRLVKGSGGTVSLLREDSTQGYVPGPLISAHYRCRAERAAAIWRIAIG
jgi:hypothetical protein